MSERTHLPVVHVRDVVHHDDGYTLVELLVTMTLAIVVLLGVLGSAEAFTRGTAKVDRRTDAQEATRRSLRDIVLQLRDARPQTGGTSPLVPAPAVTGWQAPTRRSLTFAARLSASDATTAATGWVRYCASTGVGASYLLVARQAGATYTDPGACSLTNTTTSGWVYSRAMNRALVDPDHLFDFSTASCLGATCVPTTTAATAAVTTIGVNLTVDAGAMDPALSLRGAVAVRNRTP